MLYTVVDYCAHFHTDRHNVKNGIICLISLLHSKPTPEVVHHVLPNYDVSLVLPHGSLLMEAAKEEVHGTSRVESQA